MPTEPTIETQGQLPGIHSDTPPVEVPAGSAPPNEPAVAERPSWLPESFWDADAKSIKAEDFGKHLESVEAQRAAAEARKALVPESPDKYELGLPDNVVIPEGMELDLNDPRLPALREYAHKNGWTPDEFKAVVALDVQRAMADKQAVGNAKAAEIKLLGDNATARLDAVHKFIDARAASPEQARAVAAGLMSAASVEFFESLVSAMSSQGVDAMRAGGNERQNGISDEQWEKMTPSARLAATWKPAGSRVA